VLLWDAHSIRAEIPWLFEGKLPDLNIGTAGGASAHASITEAVAQACGRAPTSRTSVNGRFKGGYITRQYGRPAEDVHAVQLEMCQSAYMRKRRPTTTTTKRWPGRCSPCCAMMVSGGAGGRRHLYAV
jgi:N-formylglutamate deformylase